MAADALHGPELRLPCPGAAAAAPGLLPRCWCSTASEARLLPLRGALPRPSFALWLPLRWRRTGAALVGFHRAR
ncbi:MAG TPA: hypothetical protein VEZ71_13105, partial [Archangium sp.]|nr:hypothetical protein [Archangium sp.]